MRINIKELEQIILERYFSDEEYAEFIKEYSGIEFPADEERRVEKRRNTYYPEDLAGEYLEEISYYVPMTESEIEEALDVREEEEVENLTKNYMGTAAVLAFRYLRAGMDYIELAQEGNIGLLKAISFYTLEDIEFSRYAEFWIIREMLNYLKDSLETIKNSYRAFFIDRKEKLQNEGIEEHIEEDEEEEGAADEVFLKTEDILHDVESVEKREKVLEKDITIDSLPYKLEKREEEILKLYYGLDTDRRYSIFEIEEKLQIPKGQGEEIFYRALEKLSSGGGRMFEL